MYTLIEAIYQFQKKSFGSTCVRQGQVSTNAKTVYIWHESQSKKTNDSVHDIDWLLGSSRQATSTSWQLECGSGKASYFQYYIDYFLEQEKM